MVPNESLVIGMISQESERAFESRQTSARAATFDGRGTYDQRLAAILHAATALIARAGYERASMRGIARASGVSLSGLYHYVDSKEKMLFLIQFRTFSALLNNLREKIHGVNDPIEQLRILIRAHLEYFAAHMDALKVCSHEMDSLSGAAYEETRDIRLEYFRLSRNIIDLVLDTHAPGSGLDRHVAAMSLFGTLNWLYRWYDPQRGPSVTAVAGQITQQFLGGLLNAHAPIPVSKAKPNTT